MNKIIEFPINKCQICYARKATKLCDKPKGTYRWVGHPPKNKGSVGGLITCDTMLCDKCATNIAGMDVCPICLEEIKKMLRG